MPQIIFYLLCSLTISIATLIFITLNEIDFKDYLVSHCMFFVAFASYYFFTFLSSNSPLIIVAFLHFF